MHRVDPGLITRSSFVLCKFTLQHYDITVALHNAVGVFKEAEDSKQLHHLIQNVNVDIDCHENIKIKLYTIKIDQVQMFI